MGKVIIFSAPSGSGKSTLVNHLMSQPEAKFAFSVSCTSRQPRPNEVNGRDYYFLTPQEFRKKIHKHEFLEYEEVYKDRFYGTLKSEVERLSEAGFVVIFDVDVKGGVNIKNFYGDRALSIFIEPPSIEDLSVRLHRRGTESPELIKMRLDKAAEELEYADRFDRILVNDDLDLAKKEVVEIVEEFLKK